MLHEIRIQSIRNHSGSKWLVTYVFLCIQIEGYAHHHGLDVQGTGLGHLYLLELWSLLGVNLRQGNSSNHALTVCMMRTKSNFRCA